MPPRARMILTPEPLPAPPPPVSAFATTAPKRHAPHQPHPDLNQVLQAIADMENRLTRRIEAVAADVDVLRESFEVLGATIHRCSLESRLCAEKLNENLRAGFSHVSGCHIENAFLYLFNFQQGFLKLLLNFIVYSRLSERGLTSAS